MNAINSMAAASQTVQRPIWCVIVSDRHRLFTTYLTQCH